MYIIGIQLLENLLFPRFWQVKYDGDAWDLVTNPEK